LTLRRLGRKCREGATKTRREIREVLPSSTDQTWMPTTWMSKLGEHEVGGESQEKGEEVLKGNAGLGEKRKV